MKPPRRSLSSAARWRLWPLFATAASLPLGTSVTIAMVTLAGAAGYISWVRYRPLRYSRNVIAIPAGLAFVAVVAAIVHASVGILMEDALRLGAIVGLLHLGIGLQPADTRRLYRVLAWSCFTAAGVAAAQVGSIAVLSLSYKTALSEILAPNELGGLAAIALLGLITTPARTHRDFTHMAPALLALLLSASRTAIVLTLAVLAASAIAVAAPKALAQLWSAARLMLIGGAVIAVRDLYVTFASGDNSDLRGRSALWRAAIETINESFPLGLGTEEAARLAKESSVDISYLSDISGQFHSVYLDLTVQYGVLGVAAGLGSVYLLARFSRPALARDRSVFLIVAAFGAGRALFESGGWLLSSQLSLATALCWVLLGSIAVRPARRHPAMRPGETTRLGRTSKEAWS